MPLARFRFRNYTELLLLLRFLVIRHDLNQFGLSSRVPVSKGCVRVAQASEAWIGVMRAFAPRGRQLESAELVSSEGPKGGAYHPGVVPELLSGELEPLSPGTFC